MAERIGLSASQCSRRRAGLEEAGYIRAYRADLDARKLGYGIEAFTRVTLSKHSDATADDFAHFLEGLGEVLRRIRWRAMRTTCCTSASARSTNSASSCSSACCRIRTSHQVRSDIVLKTIKENRGFRIGGSAGKPAKKARR